MAVIEAIILNISLKPKNARELKLEKLALKATILHDTILYSCAYMKGLATSWLIQGYFFDEG